MQCPRARSCGRSGRCCSSIPMSSTSARSDERLRSGSGVSCRVPPSRAPWPSTANQVGYSGAAGAASTCCEAGERRRRGLSRSVFAHCDSQATVEPAGEGRRNAPAPTTVLRTPLVAQRQATTSSSVPVHLDATRRGGATNAARQPARSSRRSRTRRRRTRLGGGRRLRARLGRPPHRYDHADLVTVAATGRVSPPCSPPRSPSSVAVAADL